MVVGGGGTRNMQGHGVEEALLYEDVIYHLHCLLQRGPSKAFTHRQFHLMLLEETETASSGTHSFPLTMSSPSNNKTNCITYNEDTKLINDSDAMIIYRSVKKPLMN